MYAHLLCFIIDTRKTKAAVQLYMWSLALGGSCLLARLESYIYSKMSALCVCMNVCEYAEIFWKH